MPKNPLNKGEATDPRPEQPTSTNLVPERLNFKTLLLSNPNHFGTFPKLGFKEILPKSGDTAFEQLVCLGLSPEQNRLEAVVHIKQPSGYGTDACGAGTKEYVRFFVQHGATWVDLGEAAFNVFNLTGPHPLSYSVSVPFNEPHKFCTVENILNVRAILSWNLEPTPGDPNFPAPWGNVVNSRVQVAKAPFHKVPISTLLQEGILKFDPGILKEIDLTQTLPPKPQPPEPYTALKALYAKAEVPPHRYGFTEAQAVLAQPVLDSIPDPPAALKGTAAPAATLSAISQLKAGTELAAILKELATPKGNTTYEQLVCAGYNPQTRELEAVVQLNRNAGYSGGLCSAGSTEYVSFFAFWGGAWHNLGTSTVSVHDLASITPANPVSYAVYRISNVVSMPCAGLQGIPLRAILSWEAIPTGPDFPPFWGNVINTFIQPIIGQIVDGEHLRLMRVGGVTINRISDITHLAYPRALADPAHGLPVIAGDCGGDDSPFGGELIVEGDFTPKPDVFDHLTGALLGGAKPVIYQAWATRTDIPSSPFQLTNSFNIAAFPPLAINPVTILQQALAAPGSVLGGVPTDVYYRYYESDLQAVNPRTLSAFEAGGLDEGDYRIEVKAWFWNGVAYQPIAPLSKTVHVFNGYPHTELVCITPTTCVPTTLRRPEVALTLTSVPDCADVVVTDLVKGSFTVTDRFFGSLGIALVPITIMGIPAVEPVVTVIPAPGEAVAYNGSNTTGSHGTFTLDTTGMTPCGYNIELVATDRAIVDSHCYSHWNRIGVGFCLRKKP